MAARTYRVEGMDCAHCAQELETGLSKLPGVDACRVDFTSATLIVSGDAPFDALNQRAGAFGKTLHHEAAGAAAAASTSSGKLAFVRYLLTRPDSRLALLGGAVILIGLLLGALTGQAIIADLCFVGATLLALVPVARSGLTTLIINRDFNINLLMTVAAVGAILIGETLEAATVIFLFAIGEALEGFTAERARGSIRGLLELAPPTAIRLEAAGQRTVPVAELLVGDRILIRPGDRIAMDGEVAAGESSVNQAPITGESLPVHKAPGAPVYAGTVNGEGALEVRVTRLAADSTLSRIIRLVEDARAVRAPSQRLVDQFARWYTPAVMVIAVLVALAPPLLFNAPFYNTASEQGWLYRALELLVIACPCSLVISTPVTIISAITAAARRGVLIKGGAHLEMLGTVRVVAFDKTGTLTRGRPAVTAARAVDCDGQGRCQHCDDVLALAAAVEGRSAHPLARAVTDAAAGRGLAEVYAPAEAVQNLAGRGIQGLVNGQQVTIGSHTLFDSEHPHSPELCQWITEAESAGQTTMLLSDGDRVRGFIAVADEIRPDSRQVVSHLESLGLRTVVLTGDNQAVASAIGARIGVDDVRAELLPEHKVDAIRDLLGRYGPTAMVGDGINDTPALAAATVGIAMGGAGSAQALETADVALMADDLSQLPYAVRLSRFARRLIRQNITLSLGVKLAFMLLALAGVGTLWTAVFADMGMSLAVTLNGMRPLRLK